MYAVFETFILIICNSSYSLSLEGWYENFEHVRIIANTYWRQKRKN